MPEHFLWGGCLQIGCTWPLKPGAAPLVQGPEDGVGGRQTRRTPAPPPSQTCVIRAWDRSKPLLFCPAMNTAMWEHPVTAQQVDQLKAFGYIEIPCVAKKLVCGDQGLGAMAEVETIVDKVREILSQHDGVQHG